MREADDPYVQHLVSVFNEVVEPFRITFSKVPFQSFMLKLSSFIMQRMESEISKKSFTALGALQLDKVNSLLLFYLNKFTGDKILI